MNRDGGEVSVRRVEQAGEDVDVSCAHVQWQNDCGQSEEQMAAEERRTRRWKIENGAAPLLTTTEG